MSLLKIAGRNRIFSPLRIKAKLMKIYSLWDSKMTNFTSINDLNMHNCKPALCYDNTLVINCIFLLLCTALIKRRGENM